MRTALLACSLLVAVLVRPAAAQTAFTYQGELASGGANVSGTADFRFRLYDSASGSGQIGPQSSASNVSVANGRFTALLDFGTAFVAGQPRWLEVDVRAPAGSGSFTTLAPRTLLTPVPMAMTAQSAASVPWAGVSDIPANVSGAFSPWDTSVFGINYAAGNVGIKTSNPLNALTVTGVGSFSGGLSVGGLAPAPAQFAVFGNAFMTGSVSIGSSQPVAFALGVFGDAAKPGGGSWSNLCDARLKHNVTPLQGTLDRLLSLRGYTFEYNTDAVEKGLALPGQQIGLLAQEVERVFPDWVGRDADGYRYVTERATTALMVEALRDLRAEKDREIQALKDEAASREADAAAKQREIDDLKARLELLEKRLK